MKTRGGLFIKPLVLLLLMFCAVPFVHASKVTAVATGNWNNNATWDGTAPGCYDTICIPAGITVTITSTENLESCSGILILLEGTLAFQTGKKLRLPCGSPGIIVETGASVTVGGGGGSSTYISLCGTTIWDASMGDLFGYYILPVELTSFTAEVYPFDISLFWVTASEVNNEGFYVEKSGNGTSWQRLGFVKGAGNSTAPVNYTLTDYQPFVGVNYYRLIQEDFNGAQEVLKTITVMSGLENKLHLFPNPVSNGEITVASDQFSGKLTENYLLYGVNGCLLLSGEMLIESNGTGKINFSSHLAPGVYYLKVGNDTQRLIVR